MDETSKKTAQEALNNAQKLLPKDSSGRLALIGVGRAILAVAEELEANRRLLAPVVPKFLKALELMSNPLVTVAEASRTAAALASDLPPGIDRLVPCRSCAAPMFWAATSTGKKMPMDAKPDVDGEFGVRSGTVSKSYPGPKYTSHFATCPDADTHRKTRS